MQLMEPLRECKNVSVNWKSATSLKEPPLLPEGVGGRVRAGSRERETLRDIKPWVDKTTSTTWHFFYTSGLPPPARRTRGS